MKTGVLIKSIRIYGVRKPVVVARVDSNIKEYKIKVTEDKTSLDFEVYEVENNTYIKANPLKRKSLITLVLKKNNKIVEKITVNNSFFSRLKYKLTKQGEIINPEDIPKINIIENRLIKKENQYKYKIIFETKESNFEIFEQRNKKFFKCDLVELGYNIYTTSINIQDIKKNISLYVRKRDRVFLMASFKPKEKIRNKNKEFHTVPVVGIQFCNLTGVIRPHISIQGTCIMKRPQIKILVDDEVINYNQVPLNDSNSFLINADLPFTSDIIKVLIEINGQEVLIVKIRNSFFVRLWNKIKEILKAVFIKLKIIFIVLFRGIKFLWKEHHFLVPISLWGKYAKMFVERIKGRQIIHYNPFDKMDYNKWLKENEKEEKIEKFDYNPLISILIPVYNVKKEYLRECLDSILNQTYDNYEVCLVDDCSTNKDVKEILEEYKEKDSRVKVKYRKENGHISRASNDALEMANGEFVALLDNDDLLTKNALYENVKELNNNKNIDMLYSDEDKIDINGVRCEPHFKPDFSPDTLMSLNYICHFTVIRKSIVEKVGGFEVGLEGAQDHDLFLKISEVTNNIYHIPKILYHWRMSETSTAMNLNNKNYANDKGKIVIENALKRRKLKGIVTKDPVSTYYIVNYKFDKNPKISIIIPTKDYAETLNECLSSLYKLTTYDNYEVIVVNNNSEKEETFTLFDRYKKKYNNFKIVDANFEFNYSKINNLAVKEATGEYVVLLNNDTKIITPNWLEEMVGYAALPHIGAVGPKLLYPDNTVQHGGVILGLGGVASHAYIGSSREDAGMYGRLRVPYNYSAVTAACLMISKKKYEEVGGLEEDLMVAYNDMDFNIKLLQKGYYNIFLPQVELYHYESKSRGLDTTTEKYKRFLKESDYMWNKWGKELNNDKFYNPNFSKKGWFVLERKDLGAKKQKNK